MSASPRAGTHNGFSFKAFRNTELAYRVAITNVGSAHTPPWPFLRSGLTGGSEYASIWPGGSLRMNGFRARPALRGTLDGN